MVNRPGGASACATPSLPQHAAEPLLLIPHEWKVPAATVVNRPGGASACLSLLLPQHWAVPSDLIAHECRTPAAIAVSVGAGTRVGVTTVGGTELSGAASIVPDGVDDCSTRPHPPSKSMTDRSGKTRTGFMAPALPWRSGVRCHSNNNYISPYSAMLAISEGSLGFCSGVGVGCGRVCRAGRRVFSDLDGSGPHRPAVESLASEGVFDGTECAPGDFCPRDAVERWVMAVWLVRILDGEDPGAVSSLRFVDVDTSQWWAPYVDRLADLGVTAGCATEPDRFCPFGTVSRAQMASFLGRAFQMPTASPAGFVDVSGGVACVWVAHRRYARLLGLKPGRAEQRSRRPIRCDNRRPVAFVWVAHRRHDRLLGSLRRAG